MASGGHPSLIWVTIITLYGLVLLFKQIIRPPQGPHMIVIEDFGRTAAAPSRRHRRLTASGAGQSRDSARRCAWRSGPLFPKDFPRDGEPAFFGADHGVQSILHGFEGRSAAFSPPANRSEQSKVTPRDLGLPACTRSPLDCIGELVVGPVCQFADEPRTSRSGGWAAAELAATANQFTLYRIVFFSCIFVPAMSN